MYWRDDALENDIILRDPKSKLIIMLNCRGINVLDQKSELQKAMEKMRGQVTKKQLDEEKKKQRSDLERELEKRAIRMKEYENVMTEPVTFPPSENEFHRIHAKVNGRFASATS